LGVDQRDGFTFARVGAVAEMRVEDFYPQGKRCWVWLHEKGGKHHEMPAYHTLEAYLDVYIDAAQPRDSGKAPSSAPLCGTAVYSPRKPCTATGQDDARIECILKRLGCRWDMSRDISLMFCVYTIIRSFFLIKSPQRRLAGKISPSSLSERTDYGALQRCETHP
jgi:hypothetical protein